MTKTQVYLPPEQLEALHRVAKREGKSVAALIREAIASAMGTWSEPSARGPVGLWTGATRRTAAEHDTIYDEP